jgi:signal transduction histidine kinase
MNPKQQEIVRHIYASAQGLASVVEDFLNVTKIEQGGMKYVFEPIDISQIVTDLASDMRIVAEDKKLTLTASVDENVSGNFVQGDAVKLKQVFLNIIDNSVKYTQEGFVTISLTKNSDEKTITFAVTDSGIGISDDAKQKLFTKFGRGEGASLNAGGSGLGLYLAQEIVKAHNGEIRVDSEGVGKGSRFSVILPLL